MNLNQVTVSTKDMVSSITFYELLGLKLIVHSHDAYARFECPVGESTFSLQFSEEPHVNGPHVYFEVDNVDKEYDRLQGQGVQFELPPTEQSWLWKEAHLKDPGGNHIILYHAGENRKNPSWRLTETP